MASDLQKRGVPPDDKTQPERGMDLLPLNPLVVDRAVDLKEELKAPLKLLLHVLNYLSMGGRGQPTGRSPYSRCTESSSAVHGKSPG